MTDIQDVEPIEDVSYEPEIAPDLEEPEIEETLAQEPSQTLDYERIIGGVAERLAQAAQEYGQQAPAVQYDPYSEVAALIWENPTEAIQRTVDIATRNAVQAMMPYVQPVSEGYAMHRASHGLDLETRELMHEYVREQGIDPSLLANPTVADLVRSKAKTLQMERSSRGESIPYTESAYGYPASNIDAETRRELGAMEKLYRNLNLKYEPTKLLRRMK